MTRKILRVAPGVLVLVLAMVGPLLVPLFGLPDPDKPVGGAFAGPGGRAPLGTDRLGCSVLSGVLAGGARLILAAIAIGLLCTLVALIVGGMAALHPRVRAVTDAFADGVLLVPSVIVLLIVPVVVPHAGMGTLIVTCAALGLPFTLKVISSALERFAERGFVTAARDSGESTMSVLFVDLVPQAASLLRSVLGLRIVEALYLLSVASFIGIDSGLGDHSWAVMIRTGAEGVLISPWAVAAPAVMLALTGGAIFTLTHTGEASKAEVMANAR